MSLGAASDFRWLLVLLVGLSLRGIDPSDPAAGSDKLQCQSDGGLPTVHSGLQFGNRHACRLNKTQQSISNQSISVIMND